MTKFKEFYERMIQNNKPLFDDFIKLHREYSIDQDGMQEKFKEMFSAGIEPCVNPLACFINWQV